MSFQPGRFPQYPQGNNKNEIPVPERFKGLQLSPENLECLILADQLISGEKTDDPVWSMTQFLQEKGWKLTVKGQEIDPEKSLYFPNLAYFNRDNGQKAIDITILTHQGQPFGRSLTEQVAGQVVHEYLHGQVYFRGQEILEEKSQLSEQDYQELCQQLKSIRQAEQILWGEEKPQQERSSEEWKAKIDKLLAS